MSLQKQDLTLNELLVLNSELRDAEKSLGLAYVMLIGGHLGIHRFYLKRAWTAVAQLVLGLIAFTGYLGTVLPLQLGAQINPLYLILTAAAWLPLLIWIICDLIRLPGMVRAWNRRVETEILVRIARYRDLRGNGAEQRTNGALTE